MNDQGISFFEIVTGSGTVGIIYWLFLFFLTIIGFILGIASIISSATSTDTDRRLPLALKLLLCCIAATLFTGTAGMVSGYGETFAMLGTTTGAAKAQALQLATSIARLNLTFAVIVSVLQGSCAAVSLFVMNMKREDTLSELIARVKEIPILMYIVIVMLCQSIWAYYYLFCSIEKILTLKPDMIMPGIVGMEFSTVLNICMIAAVTGLGALFMLFCMMLKNRISSTRNCS